MKRFPCPAVLLFLLLLYSCASSPVAVETPPPQATAESFSGPVEQAAAPIAVPDSRDVLLEELRAIPPAGGVREVTLRIFPGNAAVSVPETGGGTAILAALEQEKDLALYQTDAGGVLLEAEGFVPLVLPLPPEGGTAEAKLERPWEVIQKRSEIPTEWQPKSIRFAPDGKSVFVANLGVPTAMSRFSVDPPALICHFDVPGEYRDSLGFVETAILENRGEIWLSQMTTNTIHVFDMETGDHLAAIPVSGTWPKVLLASDDESRVYASCWDSASVCEIDTAARKELRSLSTGAVPRGMAFADGGGQLLVALFGSAGVDRIDLDTGKRVVLHDAAPGREYAMRHIVHDSGRGEYYITAMGVKRVYRLSEDGRWLGYWEVGDKPNTCEISPDGSRLFVSCRGPNNPDTGYLTRGYEFGRVYVVNLEDGDVEGWIWGRDQTTGLDVSPDGSLLAFTDFLSANLEIYEIAAP